MHILKLASGEIVHQEIGSEEESLDESNDEGDQVQGNGSLTGRLTQRLMKEWRTESGRSWNRRMWIGRRQIRLTTSDMKGVRNWISSIVAKVIPSLWIVLVKKQGNKADSQTSAKLLETYAVNTYSIGLRENAMVCSTKKNANCDC